MREQGWRAFKAHCDSLIRQLDLPRQFTIEALADAVARHRGRPLRFFPLRQEDGADTQICGVWIALGDSDHVYHAVGTSSLHQSHIVLHELAHMLLDHRQVGEPDEVALRQLFPDLDPRMAARLLARDPVRTDEGQEAEAELLASLLWEHFDARPSALASAPIGSVDAISSAMGTFADTYRWRVNVEAV
ncbi:hypothetical protein [Streptomyces tanashiensis]|uniref:hypothetical protein n=1 Tax=Streptomyces tanashiensis TaxID=67367 RepID=UPI0033F3B30F